MKLAYIDLETTGLFPWKHGVIQIGIIIEIDGEVKDEQSIKAKPFAQDEITPRALEVNNTTREQLEGDDYLAPAMAHGTLSSILQTYVDPYSKTDKFFFVGYNSHTFDDPFLRKFFTKNGDKYYGSYFWNPSVDVMLFAIHHMMAVRHEMKDFKLTTVAETLGITVEEELAHEAIYDVKLTRAIYHKLIGGER